MFRRRNRKNNPSIYEDNAELVERILKEGADPNFIRKSNNLSALSYAVWKRYSEVLNIFKIFLNDPRTDVNKGDRNGITPLMSICDDSVSEEVGVQLISLLLKHTQIQINKKDNIFSKFTALHYACILGRSKCVKALIEDDRIHINITDRYGQTPLYRAVYFGHLEVVKVLLSSSDIDPNILTWGETPLHKAHVFGQKEIMKELLKDNRTDPNIPDKNGKIVAKQVTDPELLEYIEPICYKDIFCI